MAYADAVAELYRSSQELFVSERKRLAAELKAAGDKTGAARLAKLARPTLSAWAVNQLWWQARPPFEELFASSERLRRGERSASAAHRDALAALRTRAGALLGAAGHAVTDATLRRVTTTLAALAAAGNFEPDEPGALSADREPPGFEAWAAAAPVAREEGEAEAGAGAAAEAEAGAAAETAAREVGEAGRLERERAEAELLEAERRQREERERREAERGRIRAALEAAQEQLAGCLGAVERVQAELALAQRGVEAARAAVSALELRLARLESTE